MTGETRVPTELKVEPRGTRRRMLLIVNPYATTVSERLKNVIVYALQSRYEVEAVDTRERNHATELCRRAVAEKHDLVVAFGGDGTANEVANGLVGTDIPFTCLPGGLTNVVCRTLGMPNDVIDATEHLLGLADRFEARAIDAGDANGRVFLFAAGVGLDADIVKLCESRPGAKSFFGQWFYMAAALGVFARDYAFRSPKMTVRSGDFAADAIVTVTQNAEAMTYFGQRPLEVCENAGLTTGTLSLVALDRANPLDVPPLATRLLSRRARVSGNRHVKHLDNFATATITSKSGAGLPLHVDGDYVGDFAEIEMSVRPGALRVVS